MKHQIELNCGWCRTSFVIASKEWARQTKRGRKTFFCSLSCGAQHNNFMRGDKAVPVEKDCPYCGKAFQSSTAPRSATYCSRSCASLDSVTDVRREKARLIGKGNLRHDVDTIAKSLCSREGWKYKEIEDYLILRKEPFCFEHVVSGLIFDLALPDKGLLIEFDGPYHKRRYQIVADLEKAEKAEKEGWHVCRIETAHNHVIDPEVLFSIL